MPVYSSSTPCVAAYPGDEVTLFNNEDVVTGTNSIRVNLPPNPGGVEAKIVISLAFAAAPTDTVNVQAAIDDVDANYITTASTSTNQQAAQLALSTNAPFVRLNVGNYVAGGKLTAKLYRAA